MTQTMKETLLNYNNERNKEKETLLNYNNIKKEKMN